eukprot:s3398_g9.t1
MSLQRWTSTAKLDMNDEVPEDEFWGDEDELQVTDVVQTLWSYRQSWNLKFSPCCSGLVIKVNAELVHATAEALELLMCLSGLICLQYLCSRTAQCCWSRAQGTFTLVIYAGVCRVVEEERKDTRNLSSRDLRALMAKETWLFAVERQKRDLVLRQRFRSHRVDQQFLTCA